MLWVVGGDFSIYFYLAPSVSLPAWGDGEERTSNVEGKLDKAENLTKPHQLA